MTWFDKSFLALGFLVVIIVQCVWQVKLIKAHKRIRHGLHAIYYLTAVAIMVYFFWPVWWQVIALALVERLALFDPFLNILRGKSFFYNGAAGSVQDRIENKLSVTWVRVLKVAYILLFIILLIKLK